MSQKRARKGALLYVSKIKISSRKIPTNGAFQIVDNSRLSWTQSLHAICQIKSKPVIKICQIESGFLDIISYLALASFSAVCSWTSLFWDGLAHVCDSLFYQWGSHKKNHAQSE